VGVARGAEGVEIEWELVIALGGHDSN